MIQKGVPNSRLGKARSSAENAGDGFSIHEFWPALTIGMLAVGVCAFFGRSGLADLAVLDDASPSLWHGLVVLSTISAKTATLIVLAVISSLAANALLNLVLVSVRALRLPVLALATGLTAIPILSLIPAWFSLFGDGWISGFLFLFGCLFLYITLTTSGTISENAEQIRQTLTVFPSSQFVRFRILAEYLFYLARGEITEVLVLSVPFSVGAEIIAGSGGLGDAATMAYRNGNFGQLLAIAGAYIVVYAIVTLISTAGRLIGRASL